MPVLLIAAALAVLAGDPAPVAPVSTVPAPLAAPAPAANSPIPTHSSAAPIQTIGPAAGQALTQAAVCDSPAAHQFDFLLGKWTVLAAQGDILAHLTVTRAADGCALLEISQPVKGVASISLMSYDAGATLWRRQQASGDGDILSLQGGPQDGQMVRDGEQSGPDPAMLARRTRLAYGFTVHETAERSKDGQIWNNWFERDFQPDAPAPDGGPSLLPPVPGTSAPAPLFKPPGAPPLGPGPGGEL